MCWSWSTRTCGFSTYCNALMCFLPLQKPKRLFFLNAHCSVWENVVVTIIMYDYQLTSYAEQRSEAAVIRSLVARFSLSPPPTLLSIPSDVTYKYLGWIGGVSGEQCTTASSIPAASLRSSASVGSGDVIYPAAVCYWQVHHVGTSAEKPWYFVISFSGNIWPAMFVLSFTKELNPIGGRVAVAPP